MASSRIFAQRGRGFISLRCSFSGGLRITQKIGNSNAKEFAYTCATSQSPLKQVLDEHSDFSVKLNKLCDDAIDNFVPKGYPQSVSDGYGRYATGHFVSSVFSSAGGVLSMQALLHAVGLGVGAIPLAAALNWVIKDGLGQLGGVIFASMVNNRFDADPKKWRLFASISMELSSLLEFITPLYPHYFLPIASVANVGKNISFLAASASRAAIHNSYAVNENLADVTAKAGSQSIFASTIGTALGIGIATVLGHHYESSLIAFTLCSTIGLLTLRECLKSVTMHALSPDKLMYIYGAYRKETLQHSENDLMLLSPSDIARVEAENILFKITPYNFFPEILASEKYGLFANRVIKRAGVQVEKICPVTIGANLGNVFHSNYSRVSEHIALFENRGYIIKIAFQNDAASMIHVLYRQGATVQDIIESYAHTFELQLLLAIDKQSIDSSVMSSDKDTQRCDEFEINRYFIELSRSALDKPVAYWSASTQRYENGRSMSIVNYFTKHIVGQLDENGYLTQEGFVTGSSVGWHINPLLLEHRYARIHGPSAENFS